MRLIKGPSLDPKSMYIKQIEILPMKFGTSKNIFLGKTELNDLVLIAWAEPGFNNFFAKAVKSFL